MRRVPSPARAALPWIVFAVAALGCGTTGDSDTESGSESESESESGAECPGCEAMDACLVDACSTEFLACFGDQYFDGSNGGPCVDYLGCVDECACDDLACEQLCAATIDLDCQSCLTSTRMCASASCNEATVCG